MTEAKPESLWGQVEEGLTSDTRELLAGFDPRLGARESVQAKIARREREAEIEAKAHKRKRRIELYGEGIGDALHDVLDPDLDFLETDTGRDVDRKGVLVEAIDNALQSEDSAERYQALRLIVDTIESVQTHRHREFRMR